MIKLDVIETTARRLNDLIAKDMPSAATGTGLDAATLIHPLTGQLKGYNLFIYGGAGATQSRIISDFIPANNRIIVEQTLSPIPSTNTQFMIFKNFSGDDYESAFTQAYEYFYDIRNNTRDMWQQHVDQLTRMQTIWLNERTSEQAAWVNSRKAEMDAWVTLKSNMQTNWLTRKVQEQMMWAGNQTNWKTALDEAWKNAHRNIRNPAFTLPTLSIVSVGSLTPGTLSIGTITIGTLPVGTLVIPSLGIAAAPSISTLGSYGSVVPDEELLLTQMAGYLAERRLNEEEEWQRRFGAFRDQADKQVTFETTMVGNLIQSSQTLWDKHKTGFNEAWQGWHNEYDKIWTGHKLSFDNLWEAHLQKYERDWDMLRTNYSEYILTVEQRWKDMSAIFRGGAVSG